MRFQINYRLFGGDQASKKLWSSQSINCLAIFSIFIFVFVFIFLSVRWNYTIAMYGRGISFVFISLDRLTRARVRAARRPFATCSAVPTADDLENMIFFIILAFFIFFFALRGFWLVAYWSVLNRMPTKHILNWIVYVYDGHRKVWALRLHNAISLCLRHSSRTRLKTDLFTYLARLGEFMEKWNEQTHTHPHLTGRFVCISEMVNTYWQKLLEKFSCRSSSSHHVLTDADEMKSSRANEIEARERKAKRMNSIAWFDRCFDEMDSCREKKNESNDCWLVASKSGGKNVMNRSGSQPWVLKLLSGSITAQPLSGRLIKQNFF